MRLVGTLAAMYLLLVPVSGFAQEQGSPAPANMDLIAVEITNPDGTREVRLVARDAIPAGAVIVDRRTEASGSSSPDAKKKAVQRPMRKGLTVSRKAVSASADQSQTLASDSASEGDSTQGGQGSNGSGGDLALGLAPPPGGADGVGSAWRPVNSGGRGLGEKPPTPSGLLAIDKHTGGGVTVKWADPSTDTIRSIIQRQSKDTTGAWGPTAEFTASQSCAHSVLS